MTGLSEQERGGLAVVILFAVLIIIMFWIHGILIHTVYHIHAPLVWIIPFIPFIAGLVRYKYNKSKNKPDERQGEQ